MIPKFALSILFFPSFAQAVTFTDLCMYPEVFIVDPYVNYDENAVIAVFEKAQIPFGEKNQKNCFLAMNHISGLDHLDLSNQFIGAQPQSI